MKIARLTLGLVPVLLGIAAQPAGVVSSPGPVTLAGTEIDSAGVPSWTVLSGDDVAATSAPALIMLRNGGRVVLGTQSKLKVEDSRLTVIEGSVHVSCQRDCHLTVTAQNRSISLRSGDHVGVLVRNGIATLTPGALAPQFEFPANRLTRRLPYTAGVYLPGSEP